MFWRKPKLTPEEHARALELVLRDLDPADRRRAEALMDRMNTKDRFETERVLVKTGVKHWPRIEKIMLRFGDLAPESGGDAGGGAASAPHDGAAPAPAPSSEERERLEREQRERANRALGR